MSQAKCASRKTSLAQLPYIVPRTAYSLANRISLGCLQGGYQTSPQQTELRNVLPVVFLEYSNELNNYFYLSVSLSAPPAAWARCGEKLSDWLNLRSTLSKKLPTSMKLQHLRIHPFKTSVHILWVGQAYQSFKMPAGTPSTTSTITSSMSNNKTPAKRLRAEPKDTTAAPPSFEPKEHDFFWTYTEEPHRTRRQAIIKAHPEVRSTFSISHLYCQIQFCQCREWKSPHNSTSPFHGFYPTVILCPLRKRNCSLFHLRWLI
jgi:hypothetical protein